MKQLRSRAVADTQDTDMQVTTSTPSTPKEAGPLCIVTEAAPPTLAPVPEPPNVDFLALMQQLPDAINISNLEVVLQQ